jgi:uncharacterized protein YlxP (DUF503 family)
MHIGLLTFELFISESLSLKDKRMIISSLKDRLRKKYNIAIAELAYQEKWQRAELGLVTIGNSHKIVEESLNKIFSYLDSQTGFELITYQFDYL